MEHQDVESQGDDCLQCPTIVAAEPTRTLHTLLDEVGLEDDVTDIAEVNQTNGNGMDTNDEERVQPMATSVSVAVATSSSSPDVAHVASAVATRVAAAHIDRATSSDIRPIVDFLLQHFVANEPILASLHIKNQKELCVLMEDLVSDCVGCASTVVAREQATSDILAVCLASKHHLFDNQMDRLCRYSFTDEPLSIAVEFLKYVFNRVDVAYHLEENGCTRPVFVCLVGVRPECQRAGLGRRILTQSLSNAREIERCDSAFTLCTWEPARIAYTKSFPTVLARVRYNEFRGEYREPPIKPASTSALSILLGRLNGH